MYIALRFFCSLQQKPITHFIVGIKLVFTFFYQVKLTYTTNPLFHTRYVNDIFLLTQKKTKLTNFYPHMNTLHTILELTLERSVDRKLPFLDTEVKLISN